MIASAFRFLNPGPLIDGELELVPPEERWVDLLMAACEHPLSASDSNARWTTRARVGEFLRAAPMGRQPEDPNLNRSPCYHFWMRLHQLRPEQANHRPLPPWGAAPPPIGIAGGISLRIGGSVDLEMYAGHIGYGVYPPARGQHYAERACRLILPLARAHGLKRIWITCNPDNGASRRTCERLGCRFAGVVPVPSSHPLFQRGDREKCRFWLDITASTGSATSVALPQ